MQAENPNLGLLGTLIERLHALSDHYLVESKRKPGGQQAREKSKREIYEQFAYELRDLESLALPPAPPQAEEPILARTVKPLTDAERDELDGLLADIMLPGFSPRERFIARRAARAAYRHCQSTSFDWQRLRNLLCNVSQIMDGWCSDPTWSAFDASVRQEVSTIQQIIAVPKNTLKQDSK